MERLRGYATAHEVKLLGCWWVAGSREELSSPLGRLAAGGSHRQLPRCLLALPPQSCWMSWRRAGAVGRALCTVHTPAGAHAAAAPRRLAFQQPVGRRVRAPQAHFAPISGVCAGFTQGPPKVRPIARAAPPPIAPFSPPTAHRSTMQALSSKATVAGAAMAAAKPASRAQRAAVVVRAQNQEVGVAQGSGGAAGAPAGQRYPYRGWPGDRPAPLARRPALTPP